MHPSFWEQPLSSTVDMLDLAVALPFSSDDGDELPMGLFKGDSGFRTLLQIKTLSFCLYPVYFDFVLDSCF